MGPAMSGRVRACNPHEDRQDPVAVPPEDTLRMPSLQLDSLLGRTRDDEEPVFLLVRRRDPIDSLEVPEQVPKESIATSAVSIVLVVAAILALCALLWALR